LVTSKLRCVAAFSKYMNFTIIRLAVESTFQKMRRRVKTLPKIDYMVRKNIFSIID
jgi:hypothetical protein